MKIEKLWKTDILYREESYQNKDFVAAFMIKTNNTVKKRKNQMALGGSKKGDVAFFEIKPEGISLHRPSSIATLDTMFEFLKENEK
jgi:hypothetical protein